VLEYSDTRLELEAFAGGTRLTLWHNIDRRFIAWAPRAGILLSMFWIGCSPVSPLDSSSTRMP
jgi:hypothetical protein